MLLVSVPMICSPFPPLLPPSQVIIESTAFLVMNIELSMTYYLQGALSKQVAASLLTPILARIIAVLANSKLQADWARLKEIQPALLDIAQQAATLFFGSIDLALGSFARPTPLHQIIEASLTELIVTYKVTRKPNGKKQGMHSTTLTKLQSSVEAQAGATITRTAQAATPKVRPSGSK